MYLHERVNSHNCHIRLALGVVHQIQINQLFKLKVVCLHAVDDIWEKGRNILADCHRGNHLKNEKNVSVFCIQILDIAGFKSLAKGMKIYLLDGFFLFLLLVIVQFRLKLKNFTFLGGCKIF